ncbi:hypothetical protein BLOT_003957 [Blomia tropicalis]|nr:hypothetical protein BLOT_003957 [Blomia tropicalis]
MDILLSDLNPIKGIKYLQKYYRNYFPSVLENGKKYYQSKKIKFFMNLLWLKSVHFLYLFIFPPKTLDDKMIHYDFANLSNLPFMNGFCIFIVSMINYFLHLLYFNFDNLVLKISYQLIFLQDDSFFIEKKYRSVPVCEYIRYVALSVLNFFQLFLIAIDLITILTHIRFYQYVWLQQLTWFASPFWGVVNLICGELSLFFFNLTCIIYGRACLLMFIFGVISTAGMYIKLNQIRQLLYSNHKYSRMPTIIEYQTFLTLISETIANFRVGNYSLGRALFAFMIVNGPISCMLMAALLNNNFDSMVFFTFNLIYAIQQLPCLFGVHVLIVTLNANLHRPVKRMIHLSIHDRKLVKMSRLKLKIHNYNVAFHTKKKYGISYASFGLITMSSFLKYILLYEEYLMFNFSINR